MSIAAGLPPMDAPAARKASARLAMTLLILINLFNYIDRQVLAAVEPDIRKELFTVDGVEAEDAKSKTGWFATAFLLSYMVVAPIFGLLADRVSRWGLIGFGVLLWTVASGATGGQWGVPVATAYWIMLITRCLVGVGEAAYGPVAPALIADMFPVEKRGRVMAWFYMAIPVGGAMGYALGGGISKAFGEEHWRWAFYCVVPPGLALGVWCYFMRDPPRGQAEKIAATGITTEPELPMRTQTEQAAATGITSDPPSLPERSPHGQTEPVAEPNVVRKLTLADYIFIIKIPSYTLNTLGMTMMSFAIGGLAFWMPAYLKQPDEATVAARADYIKTLPKANNAAEQKVQEADAVAKFPAPGDRLFGTTVDSTTLFGILTVIAGLTSTLAGGLTGDWLRPRFAGSYFLVSGIALWLAFPAILLFLYVPFPYAWIFIFLTVFFLFFNAGPTNTILANVVHPSMRGSGYALNIFVIHAFGDAISPPLIGWISGAQRVDPGFLFVSLTTVVGGTFWLIGTRYLQRDTERAPKRLPA